MLSLNFNIQPDDLCFYFDSTLEFLQFNVEKFDALNLDNKLDYGIFYLIKMENLIIKYNKYLYSAWENWYYLEL